MAPDDAPDRGPALVDYARRLCTDRLAAYAAARHDVEEHANIEVSVLAGGYAYRQVAELIQNAADAISEQTRENRSDRIEVIADEHGLWAANTGEPLDEAGVRALLNAHSSNKRAGQIGRFGLGFKSLLRLGGQVDVLSRSGCLHFDPEHTRQRIRDHLGMPALDKNVPGMRLAEATPWEDGVAAREGASRFSWATTIVFAQLASPTARPAIIEEIRKFPSEFLLFLPCDVELVLAAGDVRRHLRRSSGADGSVLIEDLAAAKAVPQRWKVFETAVTIKDGAALEDATAVHFRDSVPLIWAAPIGATREQAGRFFAFFPTTTETRTLGILNAPWKLNSDRTALIPGAWNTALMKAAAELIAGRIAELSSADDPGAVLDAFPRELQSATEPAAPLVHALWPLLEDAPVIPNCDGELRRAAELRRAPTDDHQLVEAWSHLAPPEECERHVHPTCTSTVSRTSRLGQLAGRLEQDEDEGLYALESMNEAKWLEVTATIDPEAAGDVLSLVDRYASNGTNFWWEAHRAHLKVILTQDGDVDCAANLVLGADPEPPLRAVHPLLAEKAESRQILQRRFHLKESGDVSALQLIDARIAQAEANGDWSQVWSALRRMDFEEASKIVHRRVIRVRTRAGWGRPASVYRIGELVTRAQLDSLPRALREQADQLVVDDVWHAPDHTLLDEMDIEANPSVRWVPYEWSSRVETVADIWMSEWRQKWVGRYHVSLKCAPSISQLRAGNFEMPLGWEWLLLIDGQHRQTMTHWLLAAIAEADDDEFDSVEFHHTNRYSNPVRKYPHPVWSLLLERGALGNGDAELPMSALMREDMVELVPLLPSLAARVEAFAILDAVREGWKSTRQEDESWRELLAYAAGERTEPQEVAAFYERAAAAGHAPLRVPTAEGPRPIADIYLATSDRDIELASEAGYVALCLTPRAAEVWKAAGAKDLAAHRQTEWDREAGSDVVGLVEFEPMLREVLPSAGAESAFVSLVGSLCQELGGNTVRVPWLIEDGVILVDRETLEGAGWVERVVLLVEAARAAGLIEDDDALERVLQSGPAARRRAVAEEPDLARRLLKAVGSVEPILGLFEPDVRTTLASKPGQAADVALTLFGPSLLALTTIKEAMKHEGLDPPKSWSGARSADFVAAIGFPPEYAVAPQRKREAEISVQGPVPIKDLHDFQQEVVQHLDALFVDRSKKRRRAVISLPTGAGKTRVAAETAVTRMLQPGSPNRLVLWIAQSDELCEQAVQCFRELWSNLGTPDDPLRIVRFWGSQGNPRAPEGDEPVVVVATIQTLDSRMGQLGIDWIRSPALVVIDECHHALTPTYTGAFHWLRGDADEGTPEPPIIGLSATPFRGRNEDETRQLARRFDARLFPQGQAELFDTLQARGVLARFGYTRLEILERFELTADEKQNLERFRRLPNTAMERLGTMSGRNDRIVRAIEQADEQSALVFATSVKHARRLAARLNLLGIKAAAVTGETDRNSRRWFVDAFRRGEIRVLCNHSALTTGFDAPATDLIVIARPVFSPSLYMQMVGRGLRGPVNGGKERCRILTVQDNLDQYTDLLAHHFFEQHYVD